MTHLTPEERAELRVMAEAAQEAYRAWGADPTPERWKAYTLANDLLEGSMDPSREVLALLDQIDAQAARIAELERERDELRADFLEFTHLGRRLCTPESPVADQVRDYNRRLDAARRRWAEEKK